MAIAVRELLSADIALRRIEARRARAALVRGRRAARSAGIPALAAEFERALDGLAAPAARLVERGTERPVRLEEVEALLASERFVVDACRSVVRAGGTAVPLARRPVLMALARALAEAWPGDAPRDALIAHVSAPVGNETHPRAVEGRDRPPAEDPRRDRLGVGEPPAGFARARPRAHGRGRGPPVDDEHAAVLALLSDGESWSSSALALALGTSQRTVQRSLEALASEGKARAIGRARARRWTAPPIPGFTTPLLLSIAPPTG